MRFRIASRYACILPGIVESTDRAGLRDATALAWSLNILVKRSIVCAAEGDRDAAQRAKPIAAWLIDQHKPS